MTAGKAREKAGFARRAAQGAGLAMLALGLAEVALRVAGFEYAGPGAQVAPLLRPDARVIHRMAPGRHELLGQSVQVNRWGYRGTDWAERPAAGTVRVAALGDSATFGYGVADGEEWPARLQAELRARGVAAETINLGVIGYSLTLSLADFEARGRGFGPAAVVALAGNWNDFHPSAVDPGRTDREFIARGEAPPDPAARPWWTGLRLGQLAWGLEASWRRGRDERRDRERFTRGYYAEDRPEFTRRTPLAEFEAGLRRLADEGRRTGTQVLLVIPRIRPTEAARKPIALEYARRARAVAAAEGLPTVDLAEVFAGAAEESVWLDECHFTAAGHAAIARAVAGALAPRLAAAGSMGQAGGAAGAARSLD